MKKVVIIGAGGHAKVVADIIQKSGDHIVGFLEANHKRSEFLSLPILGEDTDFRKYKENYFIIAIGSAKAREAISERMQGVKWYTAIHPSAVISSINTSIGEGSVIMPNAVINPNSIIGKHCIINSSALVEHDNSIGDFVHISVGAKCAGTVTVGNKTWIGAGATVSNDVKICEECMIGAGAVVVKSIEQKGTYVGVPAKKMHE